MSIYDWLAFSCCYIAGLMVMVLHYHDAAHYQCHLMIDDLYFNRCWAMLDRGEDITAVQDAWERVQSTR